MLTLNLRGPTTLDPPKKKLSKSPSRQGVVGGLCSGSWLINPKNITYDFAKTKPD
jgi:hypothetical protein